MLRPRGGGESLAFAMGHGDLLVMGGSCQRTWEHASPRSPAPARASPSSSGRSTSSDRRPKPRGPRSSFRSVSVFGSPAVERTPGSARGQRSVREQPRGRQHDHPAALPVGPEQHRQHGGAQVDRVVLSALRRRSGGRRLGDGRRRLGGLGRAPRRRGPGESGRRRETGVGSACGAPCRSSAAGADSWPDSPEGCCGGICRRAGSRGRPRTGPSSLSETSCITPRPNCAGLPVIARSVTHLDVGACRWRRPCQRDVSRPPYRCRACPCPSRRRRTGARPRPSPRTCRSRCRPARSGRASPCRTPRRCRRRPRSRSRRGSTPPATAMSLKCAQVSSTGVGHGEPVGQFHAASASRGGEHRASGQHRRQVPAVVGVAVEVRGRVGALGGRGRGRAYGVLGRRLPGERLPRPRAPATGSSPCWSARSVPRRWCRPRP